MKGPLAEVTGHKTQIGQLDSLLRLKTIPHALLFSGPAAAGKRFAATRFAVSRLTGHIESESERKRVENHFHSGTHPDFHFLTLEEGKKDISVESVRELCSRLHLKPYSSPCSVALIDDAHLLNIAASNALLMTLEEAPAHSQLILVTHMPHRLPDTIVSRCQPLFFGPLAAEEIFQICSKLFAPMAEKDVKKLISLCSGSLEALQLDAFIDKKTSKVKEGLAEYLASLSSHVDDVVRKVKALLGAGENAPAAAMNAASELGAKDELSDVVWQTLRSEVRKRLLQSGKDEMLHWADALMETLQTEKLVKERNLNAQIQLSKLFLDLASRG